MADMSISPSVGQTSVVPSGGNTEAINSIVGQLEGLIKNPPPGVDVKGQIASLLAKLKPELGTTGESKLPTEIQSLLHTVDTSSVPAQGLLPGGVPANDGTGYGGPFNNGTPG